MLTLYLYPLYWRLGGPQGRSGQVRKLSSPSGFDPWKVQPVASCYTDWSTVAHEFVCMALLESNSCLERSQGALRILAKVVQCRIIVYRFAIWHHRLCSPAYSSWTALTIYAGSTSKTLLPMYQHTGCSVYIIRLESTPTQLSEFRYCNMFLFKISLQYTSKTCKNPSFSNT